MAIRRLKGGNCSASYTSPKAPDPIQRVTLQSPSSAPCSKYLQNWHVTCSSTTTEALMGAVSTRVADVVRFSCAFLGFKQYVIASLLCDVHWSSLPDGLRCHE